MYKIHPLSDVQTEKIGENTLVWQYSIILKEAVIGRSCNINCHTFIENDVLIGNNVTVKSGIYIWDGITIEDDVFLGPNVVFTNDLKPRSKQHIKPIRTVVKKGASIGANSTILAGVIIGEYAMSGTASNITRDVPSHALVYGNPATIKGWIDEYGNKLKQKNDTIWLSEDDQEYLMTSTGLKKKI